MNKQLKWSGIGLAGAIAVGLALQWPSGTQMQGKPFQRSQADAHEREEREGRYDEPEAFVRMWEARREGTGERSPAQVNLEQSAVAASRGSATAPAYGFSELGPGNFGGRSRGLLVHATDTNRLLFSSVSGGFWRSEDEGQSWAPVGDFIASLAIGSLVQDPDQPGRVFAGTGEGFFNGDAQRGAGIFRSDDFGSNWTQITSTNNPNFHYVNRLAMVPGTDTILAATRSGLWRSTNLGTDWTRVATDLHVDNRGYVDVKVDPTTPQRLLAYHYGSANGRGPIPQVVVSGLPTVIGVQMSGAPATPATPINAPLALVNDGVGTPSDFCEALPAGSLSGRIALMDRGNCTFVIKINNATTAGALYAVIAQNVAEAPFAGGATGVTLPAMMISQADGNALKNAINGIIPGVVFRDGFEDAGAGSVAASVSGPLTLTNYVARSTDGGATWSQLVLASGLPESDMGRVELAWGPGNVAYAAIANAADATRGLWRSADGGASWVKTASTTAFIERQGWYDLVLAVAPNDANKVYMGAVDQFISTDGGAVITKRSFWNPSAGQMPVYIHADQHAYTFKPGAPNTIYTLSDGGVHRSTDGGTTYVDLNNGLNAAMPNNVAVRPNGLPVHGTQDNGSHFAFASGENVWIEWSGGDGGNVAADPTDSNFFYSSRPQGSFFGTSTAGATEAAFTLAVAGSQTNALFYAPIAIDPNNGQRLAVGVAGVQFTQNARSLAGATWTQIAMPVSFGTLTNTITISPLDGTVAYAGSTTGAIVRITGLGTTNTVTSIQGNLPTGSDISAILIDPADGNHLYVALADYGTNRVWETFNGGTSWTSIHAGLADVPMFSLAFVPGTTGQLLLGSEIGLWHGSRVGNGPVTWSRFSYGIPYTRVPGIAVRGNDMYFAVYGRGTFKGNRSPLQVSIGELRADTGCDADGNLDETETATVPVTVRNLSNQSLTNVTLGLAASNPAIGAILPQVLPTLTANASQTTNFSVVMGSSAACPDSTSLTATATVNSLSATAVRTFGLDQNTAILPSLVDGAESVDTVLTSNTVLGTGGWARTNTQANTGSFSWFAATEPQYAEKNLVSPWVDVTSGTAALAFALRYQTEGDATQRWDGAVLEVRTRANIDGTPGRWVDVGASGTVPYDGLLFNNTPLGPARRAWSGTQTTWRTSSVPLGAFNGQQLQFRFRLVSDSSTSETGFWIDDLNLSGVSVRGVPSCDAVCN